MSRALSLADFPQPTDAVRASWAPIFIEPLAGSGERLTVAVVAANTDNFFVARANRLDRLKCLYGNEAQGIEFAIDVSLDAYDSMLAEVGLSAMRDPEWIFASIHLGQIRDGAGNSVEEIARQWLAYSSSFHDQPTPGLIAKTAELRGFGSEDLAPVSVIRDRLPKLVHDYVVERQPRLSKAFSDVSIQVAQGRRRRKSHEVNIDFYGAKIVANLGTLVAGGIGTSVEHLKRKMWDLKVARDQHGSPLLHLRHEMLVQHPANDDPQLSQRQLDNLNEALSELERQADLEQLRLRPLTTVREIGEHILRAEAA